MEVRTARPADVEQIIALQMERNGDDCEPALRQLFADSSIGTDRFTVAVDDTNNVVSSLCLLDQAFTLDGVDLPGGQPEYVATAVDHGHRGLVREQMTLVHEWSARKGDLLQVIAGIPYFYRRFGYEYAVPFARTRLVDPGIPLEMPPRWSVRAAVDDDVPDLRRLQRAAQADASLVAVADDAWWRRSLSLDGRPWMVAERDGAVRATAMVGGGPPGVGSAVTVLSAPAAERVGGLWALLAHAATLGRPVGFESRRSATAVLDGVSHLHPHSYALYARVPDAVAMLDRLRPVLSARLARSHRAGTSGTLLLSFFVSSAVLTWDATGVARVEPGPPEQDPTSKGGAGIPPDLVATLLLGRHGAAGLASRHDDVQLGAVGDLLEALFPRLDADLSLL